MLDRARLFKAVPLQPLRLNTLPWSTVQLQPTQSFKGLRPRQWWKRLAVEMCVGKNLSSSESKVIWRPRTPLYYLFSCLPAIPNKTDNSKIKHKFTADLTCQHLSRFFLFLSKMCPWSEMMNCDLLVTLLWYWWRNFQISSAAPCVGFEEQTLV